MCVYINMSSLFKLKYWFTSSITGTTFINYAILKGNQREIKGVQVVNFDLIF